MNVEFDNDYRSERQALYEVEQAKGIVGWLIKKRIVKDQSQANMLLMVIITINFIVTLLVIYYFIW
jgi:hypothetical protein